MKTFIYSGLLLLLLGACAHRSTEPKGETVIDKPQFTNVKEVKTEHQSLNEVLNIKDWDICGSSIICMSSNHDTLFYQYDVNDFSFQKSFGVTGQGPMEYIFPSIVRHSGQLSILDNGNRSLNSVSSRQLKQKLYDLKLKEPANNPAALNDSLLCYIGNTPNTLFLYLYNLRTQSVVDSISFNDESKKGNSGMYDFAYDIYGDHLVIAHLYLDQFSVYQISDKGFKKEYQVNGLKEGEQEGKYYYSDVCCSPDGFMLLSNAEVNGATKTGQSVIESYSWKVEPIEKLKLDMIGSNFLRNSLNTILWLRSPMDDDIYSIHLP